MDNHRRDPLLATDLDWCEAVARQNSKFFHSSFHSLPKEKADAVWAVNAFYRRFSDAVDCPATPEEFDLLRMQWVRFQDGETPGTHMWRALRWAFGRFDLTSGPFEDLVRGLDSDRAFMQPEDEAALFRYCHLTAGTVGLMLLPILGIRSSWLVLEPAAIRLGDAMRLTRILRDVGEDLARGRIHFPKTAMEEFGVSASDLSPGKPSEGFRALWEYYAQIAEGWYAEFLRTTACYEKDCRRPLRVVARVHRGILDEVRRNGYDCLTERHSVPSWRKFVLSAEGWIR